MMPRPVIAGVVIVGELVIPAFNKFHHERRDAVAFFEPVDGGDVRMIERGEDFGFATETRSASYQSHDRPHPYHRPQEPRGFRTDRGACRPRWAEWLEL